MALTQTKDRAKNNVYFFLFSGRLGWTDDIDFDLNGDLTNNGYLNK